MLTDKVPRNEDKKREYSRSDTMRAINLPPAEPARTQTLHLKEALAVGNRKAVQLACKEIIKMLADFYEVKPPTIKVLAARPRKVTEDWVYETFGDYDPDTLEIRLWMRTAVQKKPTSYGTLLHPFMSLSRHQNMLQTSKEYLQYRASVARVPSSRFWNMTRSRRC